MTYDEALKQLEEIITSLEQEEALSMEAYKEKAQQAKQLIEFCQKQLHTIENELQEIMPK